MISNLQFLVFNYYKAPKGLKYLENHSDNSLVGYYSAKVVP